MILIQNNPIRLRCLPRSGPCLQPLCMVPCRAPQSSPRKARPLGPARLPPTCPRQPRRPTASTDARVRGQSRVRAASCKCPPLANPLAAAGHPPYPRCRSFACRPYKPLIPRAERVPDRPPPAAVRAGISAVGSRQARAGGRRPPPSTTAPPRPMIPPPAPVSHPPAFPRAPSAETGAGSHAT